MTHKRLQLASQELSYISDEIWGKLHMEEEVSVAELNRLGDAVEAVKECLRDEALAEGLRGD